MKGGASITAAAAGRRAGRAARRTQTQNARALAFPFVVSTALHGLAALVIAVIAAGGAGIESPLPVSTIRATLAPAPPPFVVPEPEPAATPAVPAPAVRPPAESVVAPVPLPPRAAPRDLTSQGQVTIGALGTDEAADRAVESIVRQLHPRAPRTPVEFDPSPLGVYPKAALSGKLQFQINVAVVVHEDGRVELVQGTLDDAVFAPSIRAALATARARPLEVNGQAQTSWGLVSFSFEFVGER